MSINRKPRILCWDIETSYMEVAAFGMRDQNFSNEQVLKGSTIISWAAKWVGEKKIYQQDVEGQRDLRDDKRILKQLWNLLNDSDILLSQNGVSFDLKVANARFIINGMGPVSKSRQIDTLKLSRKFFKFQSHKLEYMTGVLTPDTKKDSHREFPGMSLWIACMQGNKRAWACMRKYNKVDVSSLEAVYERMRPWQDTVDLRVFNPRPVIACPACLSESVQSRGYFYTNAGKFRKLQCTNCSHWFSEKGSRNNQLTKEKRASLQGSASIKPKKAGKANG